MNGSPKSESFLNASDISQLLSGNMNGAESKQTLQTVQTLSTPLLLYPVSADRVVSTTTTADGKTIFKIAPGTVVPVKLPAPTPTQENVSQFTYQSIMYLIEAVGRRWSMYSSRERSKLFLSVQKELEDQGIQLPMEKIRRKWNNLVVTYKRVKDRSRETGQAKTSWEYYEMMDAMMGSSLTQVSGSASPPLLDVPISPKETLASCEQPSPKTPPCFLPTNTPPSRKPLPQQRKTSFSSSSTMLAQQSRRAEDHTALLQAFLQAQEERGRRDQERQRRCEARARRRERREGRVADSLNRIATSLELTAAKQETMIALLQRLADR